MTIEPSPEAIEAAAQVLMTENACAKDIYNRCKVHTGSRWDLAEDVCRDAQGEAELALEAALPALEQQIREQVMEEILDEYGDDDYPHPDQSGLKLAAKIALGMEQP